MVSQPTVERVTKSVARAAERGSPLQKSGGASAGGVVKRGGFQYWKIVTA